MHGLHHSFSISDIYTSGNDIHRITLSFLCIHRENHLTTYCFELFFFMPVPILLLILITKQNKRFVNFQSLNAKLFLSKGDSRIGFTGIYIYIYIYVSTFIYPYRDINTIIIAIYTYVETVKSDIPEARGTRMEIIALNDVTWNAVWFDKFTMV